MRGSAPRPGRKMIPPAPTGFLFQFTQGSRAGYLRGQVFLFPLYTESPPAETGPGAKG